MHHLPWLTALLLSRVTKQLFIGQKGGGDNCESFAFITDPFSFEVSGPAGLTCSALLFLLGLDAVVNFFAMHRDFLGRIDANADLISLDIRGQYTY